MRLKLTSSCEAHPSDAWEKLRDIVDAILFLKAPPSSPARSHASMVARAPATDDARLRARPDHHQQGRWIFQPSLTTGAGAGPTPWHIERSAQGIAWHPRS
jgi:hypothetical protein